MSGLIAAADPKRHFMLCGCCYFFVINIMMIVLNINDNASASTCIFFRRGE